MSVLVREVLVVHRKCLLSLTSRLADSLVPFCDAAGELIFFKTRNNYLKPLDILIPCVPQLSRIALPK